MSIGIASEVVQDENTNARLEFEAMYGQVWNTEEMTTDFEVGRFCAGIVVVTRKSDNQIGSLEFNHNPRFYYLFKEHKF
jgi:hypothetical protein